MSSMGLRGAVRVRHYEERDVDDRLRLLFDSAFQSNINDLATARHRDALRDRELESINNGQWVKRVFAVETRRTAQLLGFCWITSIDWVSASCELSIALLPEKRLGLGLVAHQAVSAYLFDELGMEVIVHQVLGHNVMLLSADRAREFATLVSRGDDVTSGQRRDALYWTETRADFLAAQRDAEDRRATLRARAQEAARR